MPNLAPPKIPSRLKIGLDVPWVTSWTAELAASVGPCPTVDGAIAGLQAWKPGEGQPIYSRNHLRRQRDSVRALLCPMCGLPTTDGDRWSQTGAHVAAGVLRSRGFGAAVPADLADERVLLDVGAIAPLHRACAERALRLCPNLAARADRTLKPFPPAWFVIPLYVEAQDRKSGNAFPAVSFVQLVGITERNDPDWRNGPPRD